jgi:hypothetical protein
LPRAFPLYPKKRGHRRTGSKTGGSVGAFVFASILFCIGLGILLLILFSLVIPQWRVNQEFVESRAKVLDKRISERHDEDGVTYCPEIQIEYTVEGVVYRAWTFEITKMYSSNRSAKQAILDRFPIGAEKPCWYDPQHPEQVVLVRGFSWLTLLFLILPAVFLVGGAYGVISVVLQWGKSAERRAVWAQKVQQSEIFRPNGRGENTYPNVPERTDITNSPGTRLRYRLPIESSPGWAVFGLLLGSLGWNAGVGVMVYFVVKGHLAGDPDWILTVFCLPFVLAGLFLVYLFFRKLLEATGIGPTLLEISEHPLYPGGEYRFFLSQTGRLMVNALALSLVCEERATYQQGTNTRTETRRAFQRELFRSEGFEIPPGLPFETECSFQIPRGAMHSFKSDHNEIQWTLVIQGDIAGWPDYQRTFPVLVYPSQDPTDHAIHL